MVSDREPLSCSLLSVCSSGEQLKDIHQLTYFLSCFSWQEFSKKQLNVPQNMTCNQNPVSGSWLMNTMHRYVLILHSVLCTHTTQCAVTSWRWLCRAVMCTFSAQKRLLQVEVTKKFQCGQTEGATRSVNKGKRQIYSSFRSTFNFNIFVTVTWFNYDGCYISQMIIMVNEWAEIAVPVMSDGSVIFLSSQKLSSFPLNSAQLGWYLCAATVILVSHKLHGS